MSEAGRPFLLHQIEMSLWMCTHDAVIARMSCDRSVQVAGAEVKKAIRAFHYVANAAKLVSPEDLLHGHHPPARPIQKNLVHVMSEGVVGEAKQADQHASIPAGYDRSLIERHA